jgi:signal transduction histidine kinase
MRPGDFRNDWRFLGCAGATALVGTTAPALANPFGSPTLVANAPLAIALGAAAFGVIALAALKRRGEAARLERQRAAAQIAALRADLDEREALIASAREVTVLWAESGMPRVFGPAGVLLPPGRRPEAILDFSQWIADADIDRLTLALESLRVHGDGFALSLGTRVGGEVRASGTPLGVGAVVRFRPIMERAPLTEPVEPGATDLLAGLDLPAFIRDETGRLGFANSTYRALCTRLGLAVGAGVAPELQDGATRARHLAALATAEGPVRTELVLPPGRFEFVEFRLGQGSAGYLRPLPPPALASPPDQRAAAVIAALSIPAALFGADHQLLVYNAAYAALWKLDGWLTPGLDERVILDRMRRDGLLPSEPDYQGWRNRHLASYSLKARRTEPWHLPDGRMLNVTAAPAGPAGGVIYLFEDMSREMELLSQNRALLSVQRSTLNALSDAVAVFGTNGRLQLFNPRLSAVWQLPLDLLERGPHIDQLADAVAQVWPDDGAEIWRDLKRAVIDLSPTRADLTGRLTRSDGRLLDYAVVRLPDGQKLVTFLDVTESANYSRVLKERNDALVTADRLKDAFVQNVSYELRSPLTNIIGFADLLASPEVGPLTDRQRAYTDYIRASSVTLGILIDNILDLATVDAGIAELRPEPQDVGALVDNARAGFAASFPDLGDGNGIRLRVDIPPGLPTLIADGTRVVQVLYNLLSSAARFSRPGGEVRLSVASRGTRLLFVVEDDGAAASEDLADALAERPDPGLAGRDRGAGLGLAIVRAFVNLHGGTIQVERAPGGGSRVIVNLPIDASAVGTDAAE